MTRVSFIEITPIKVIGYVNKCYSCDFFLSTYTGSAEVQKSCPVCIFWSNSSHNIFLLGKSHSGFNNIATKYNVTNTMGIMWTINALIVLKK